METKLHKAQSNIAKNNAEQKPARFTDLLDVWSKKDEEEFIQKTKSLFSCILYQNYAIA